MVIKMKEEEIDCEYKDKCVSYKTWKCLQCKHNKKLKKDYYEPNFPYYPYYPYINDYTWDPIMREYGYVRKDANK